MLGRKTPSLLPFLLGVSLWGQQASAEYGYLTHESGDGFKCAGVYGSSKEHSGKRSTIELEFPPEPPSDIAIAIFDYSDSRWIGIPVKSGTQIPDEQVGMPETFTNSDEDPDNSDRQEGIHRFTVCNNETIAMSLCSEVDRGRPLINYRDTAGNLRVFKSTIYSDYIMLNRAGIGYTRLENKDWLSAHNGTDNHDESWRSKARTSYVDGATLEWSAEGTLKVTYLVNTTGYYCVDAASLHDFTARAQWANAHGLLPASEYPKLYVYFVLMVAYIGIAVAWAYMSWRVWSEILPVQNQLFGLICLLAVDMGMNFGFWKQYNTAGSPSIVFSVFTVVIDAGRNSLSFFMLLVVALGWGVVSPSLGKTMIRCILLAMLHFSAGCLYGAGIIFRDPHESGPLGLIYVVPLSFTMTLFYIWTLSAIINTTQLLMARQQSYKLSMYNNLWRLLMVSLVLLFIFFVLNVMHTVFYSRPSLAARAWRWRWFWTDGWLNLEYFVVLCIILYWWRPTSQNYRYSLEELAGDEEEAMERDAAARRDSFDNPQMGENLELDVIGGSAKGDKRVSIAGDDVQFVVNDDSELDSDEEGAHQAISSPSHPQQQKKGGYALAPSGLDRSSLTDRSSRAETLYEAPDYSDDEDLVTGAASSSAGTNRKTKGRLHPRNLDDTPRHLPPCEDLDLLATPPRVHQTRGQHRRSVLSAQDSSAGVLWAHGHRDICDYHGCTQIETLVCGTTLTRYRHALYQAHKMVLPDVDSSVEHLAGAVIFLRSIGIALADLNIRNAMLQLASQSEQQQQHTPSISTRGVHNLVREQVVLNFGDSGAGSIQSGLQVKYFSPRTRLGILKVPRDHYQMVWAALTLTTHYSKHPCLIRVWHVSGTIKKCQKAAIRVDRELIVAWHKEQVELAKLGAVPVTGDSALTSMLQESEAQISAVDM
ncbi:hypothetical protein GQ54DRAFT_301830 [Martensiomyces pterosporus]|nr:hypothetical protein GQ54DRAFT_301830 [Martensiomyces pterosporus]